MHEYPIPIIGICAYSGTGKTTLLTRVLPLLRARTIRVAVIKHAHHSFEMDTPGKDSYALRKAGAMQMLVASRHRMALLTETPKRLDEPSLEDALALLRTERSDLVLVEGFKHEHIPKIELHRPALGRALLCESDRDIVAVASDQAVRLPPAVRQLDLNAPEQVAQFIVDYCKLDDRQGELRSRATR